MITKDMSIADIVREHPETVPVFMSHGLGCIGCAIAQFETLEEGAMVHGIDVEKLLVDLNKAVESE